MNILSVIKFDWSMIFGFFCGIVFGISITLLIYLLVVLLGVKRQTKIVKTKVDVNEASVLIRVNKTKEAFKERKCKGNESLAYAYDLCSKLTIDIASDFYPDSKYPLLELSIDEILLLSEYVSKRMDDILNHRGLRMFRNIKISNIMQMLDVKRAVDDNPVIKATRKYKLKATWNSTRKVINLINPLWWARKLVIDGALSIVVNKLCIVAIGIVGEETYKIYSKKVFNIESNIDTGINEELRELDEIISREEADLNE